MPYNNSFCDNTSQLINPLAYRLCSQQLVSPQFLDPAQLVSYMGAMQAQEYRQMRWAVAMRTQRPSIDAFRQAYDEGRIIRMHLLRGTWQLIAGEDYHWMRELCAPKGLAVIKGWMNANKISISEEEHVAVRELLCRVASDLGSVTKEDFVAALAQKGMTMDDHRLSYHIRFAELSGHLCSGSLHPSKATYSLAAAKVAQGPRYSREASLALLARKYFQSHAPATFEDWVWWSGLSITDCKKGIALLGKELIKTQFAGREFFLHQGFREQTEAPQSTILLPAYDEYLIGYKSRDLALAPEHTHHAHTRNGIFYPVIVCDGKVCGNWTPFKSEPNAQFFALDTQPEELESRWQDYCAVRQK